MTRFGMYQGFMPIIFSSICSTLGIGVWVHSGFEKPDLIIVFFIISLLSFVFFRTNKEFLLVLKKDFEYRRKLLRFYVFGSILTLVCTSIFLPLQFFSGFVLVFWGVRMAKEMILKYECITGEKLSK
ncbi:hypothetical protein ORG55_003140 [Vibrio fluvialis]|nr:hypothetical protein [Vibrio fluvialis]